MDIKSIIQKNKDRKFLEEGDVVIRSFIDNKVKEITKKTLEEITSNIVSEVKNIVEDKINDLIRNVKKGDKGDKPILGKDYLLPRDGIDGKDADEEVIIEKVYKIVEKKIKTPQNGKDAIVDYPFVVSKVLEKMPKEKEETPEEEANEIADRLNILEEKVDIKVIKGLNNWLNNLKNSIREKSSGGGGMGTPVHESHSLTTVTTYVDTTSNIAASGYALWVYYQGQMVARGVGYTVSGKRITLLFTPENGTYLDIMYIRA